MRRMWYAYILSALLIGLTFSSNIWAQKQQNFKLPKDFVYIPPGELKIEEKEVSIKAFYILKTEVTNKQYAEFLNYLKNNNKEAAYEIAKVNVALWDNVQIDGAKEYKEKYSNWENYPVVNITREAAFLYCDYLTIKHNLPKALKLRLPKTEEWMWAASGGLEECDYPWGNNMKNEKNEYQAQFKTLGAKLGPAEVGTFNCNNFGLYDMAGNVSEMVSNPNILKGGSWNSSSEDIKINSEEKYTQAPTTGFRPVISYAL